MRKIYSRRPLPVTKGCRWMTYHLTVKYCNYTYEEGNEQINDNVPEIGT